MKTTEITVQLDAQELEELLYEGRKEVEWRGHLPLTIKISDDEQVLDIPYKIKVVKNTEWE